MNKQQQKPVVDQPTYWREAGGEVWAKNIETVERQIAGLSEILLDRASPQRGEAIVDVGCGGGVTSMAAAEAVGPTGEVLGVDVSDLILAVARHRFADIDNLSFDAGDAEVMHLPEARFDLLLSRFGVMFFEDPIAAFLNLRGSLKPGGRLVFICWRTPQENPWMGIPVAAVFEAIDAPPAPPPDPKAPGPFAFGDPDRVRQILTAAGFANIELEPIDADVNLGSVDRAVNLLTELGPAAALLAEASENEREAAIASVRQALGQFETEDGLRLPSATWIVTATN